MQLIKGFLLWVFCLIAADAFPQQVNFRHLTIDDGLSQNAVYSILQDSRGFMWFGTKDGLNRYDGRNFVVYQQNPFDSTSISNDIVKAHGGQIIIKPKEDEGTSFIIELHV